MTGTPPWLLGRRGRNRLPKKLKMLQMQKIKTGRKKLLKWFVEIIKWLKQKDILMESEICNFDTDLWHLALLSVTFVKSITFVTELILFSATFFTFVTFVTELTLLSATFVTCVTLVTELTLLSLTFVTCVISITFVKFVTFVTFGLTLLSGPGWDAGPAAGSYIGSTWLRRFKEDSNLIW